MRKWTTRNKPVNFHMIRFSTWNYSPNNKFAGLAPVLWRKLPWCAKLVLLAVAIAFFDWSRFFFNSAVQTCDWRKQLRWLLSQQVAIQRFTLRRNRARLGPRHHHTRWEPTDKLISERRRRPDRPRGAFSRVVQSRADRTVHSIKSESTKNRPGAVAAAIPTVCTLHRTAGRWQAACQGAAGIRQFVTNAPNHLLWADCAPNSPLRGHGTEGETINAVSPLVPHMLGFNFWRRVALRVKPRFAWQPTVLLESLRKGGGVVTNPQRKTADHSDGNIAANPWKSRSDPCEQPQTELTLVHRNYTSGVIHEQAQFSDPISLN